MILIIRVMKRFSILYLLLLTMVAWSQQEGIIYTEYDPMPYVKGFPGGIEGSIRFDIDFDTITDFSVLVGNDRNGNKVAHFCAHGDREPYYVRANLPYWQNNTTKFVRSSVIPEETPLNASQNWSYFSDFSGEESCYFGMKVIHGDSVYYSWCQMQLHSYGKDSNRVELMRSAICTIPNYPLRMGQKSTLVDNIQTSTELVWVRKVINGTLQLESQWPIFIKGVTIYNFMGRPVWAKTWSEKRSSVLADINYLDNGVYLICCELDNGRIVTKKMLVWNH